jgi:7-cyano-7-deazaguanine synthase
VNVDLRSIGGSALTADIDVPESGGAGIPVTYVPRATPSCCRWPWAGPKCSAPTEIHCGVNAVDYSGYPDCRPEFHRRLRAPGRARHQGRGRGLAACAWIAPLMRMSKADIVREGMRLGVDFARTVSCYQA